MKFALVLILAAIGALIGWITNYIAIKLLFRPFEPVMIPLLNIKLQGLIPKRKNEIAKSIGTTIQEELLSIEEIIEQFISNQDQSALIEIIKNKINRVLEERLPGILPASLKSAIKRYIDEVIEQEATDLINASVENMIHSASEKINLAEMVEKRINRFPMDKLEEMVLRIAKRELKHIEVLGGVLGFIIGLVQGIIIMLL
ncbi:DUF445 domain-containing protein [Alkaliphilus crotonatoxidans]